jgi:hypothetical protein
MLPASPPCVSELPFEVVPKNENLISENNIFCSWYYIEFQ